MLYILDLAIYYRENDVGLEVGLTGEQQLFG